MLRVALAKGRLLKSFIEYLQQVNQIDIATVLLNRQRQLLLTVDNIEMILVKRKRCSYLCRTRYC